MTPKEALKAVMRGEYAKADEVIIEVLEKQIPKKPYRITSEIIHCSVCTNPIRLGEKFCDNFCDVCGQAIDWSDEE